MMVNEIVRFMEILDDDFKILGLKPKEGLHILLTLKEQDGNWILDQENYQYEIYSKRSNEISDFLTKCMHFSQNSWMINTNKCFDTPAKSIHSCSPYCVGFKREHLEEGEKFILCKQNNKEQIYSRFQNYFDKAFSFFDDNQMIEKYNCFRDFFIQLESKFFFNKLFKLIEVEIESKRSFIESKIKKLIEEQKNSDKNIIVEIKKKSDELKIELESVRALSDKDYIIFYLDVPLDDYKKVHQKYLSDSLFNKADYNTLENEQSEVFGVSGFFNSIDSGGKKPFWIHQTAPFDITGRISNKFANYLYDFEDLLKRGVLPNPLPIFIFKEELQSEVISLFKDSNFKLSYKEIIEKLWSKYKNDFGNYYLLFYQNTKDGLIIKDFDYISNFDFELRDGNGNIWEVNDLFKIDFSFTIDNVFEFQTKVMQCIFNNNLIVKTKDSSWQFKYFDELDSKYFKSVNNYIIALKYRAVFYEFVYKSKRQSVSKSIFDDIMLTTILEDVRLDKIVNGNNSEYFNIRRKLNIWFSLYEKFSFNNIYGEPDMASKLIEYQKFVESLSLGNIDFEVIKDQHFAFATGQVIDYIRNKSKSTDKSYLLLEPYLQQSECSGLKKAISNEFSRFKHENFSRKFENVASFVLSYETDTNMKKLLPEILAGIFSKNQLYSDKDYISQSNNIQEMNEDE